MFKHRPSSAIAALSIALASWTLAAIPEGARAQKQGDAAIREIEIVVEGAYEPNRIEIEEGERVRLKFLRKTQSGCTREVLFPKLGIKRELPPEKPVRIELPTLAPGSYAFHCGMNMVKGTLVVKPRTQR